MGKASRDKGKRGEREWRDFLKEHGLDARRGRQYSGDPSAPDVVCPAMDDDFHCEVKNTEVLKAHQFLAQARGDAGDAIPYVAWKKNHKPWLVLMDAEDFIRLVKGEV